jgi:hypothetical protein
MILACLSRRVGTVATEPHRQLNFGLAIGDFGFVRHAKLVEHQGNAPCIPVWKTGVFLSTPMLEMESRAGFAPASAVLQTAACAARLTGQYWFGFGQEAGIRTRTVRFTGGDAAVTSQS